MNKVALLTDSTSSIPDDLLKKYEIYVIPQHVIWGMEDLKDGVDMTAEQFYERLAKDAVHPKTSQPPVPEFVEVINKAKKDGASEVIICTVSGPLSGTFAAAQSATGDVDIPVRVHDSRSAAMGLGWQVIAAARAREKGADANGMIEAADKIRSTLTVLFVVDTLDYLHKGGRIGKAQQLIGTALNLKPQLVLDPTSGIIEPGERTRTRTKAVEATYQAYFRRMDTARPMHIGLHHAAAAQDCSAIADRIRLEYPKAEVVVTELTPVLGTHLGPGALGWCGYYES